MNIQKIAISALSVVLLAGITAASAQYYGPPAPPPQQGYYNQGPAWDAVPPEFREAQQRGFHDGIEGARKDFENHRRPDVENRKEYRDPKFIRPEDRRDYREGFRRGYYVAVRHMYGPGPY